MTVQPTSEPVRDGAAQDGATRDGATLRGAGPRVTTWALLVLFLVGMCGRQYGVYNQTMLQDPSVWTSVLRGDANAPEQYRVGVVMAANGMTRHLPLTLSRAFAVLDLGASLLAVLLLYSVLERGRVFMQATTAMQWFGSAAFVALALYALDWASWYGRVSTLPTTGLVALTVWLWTPGSAAATRKGVVLRAVAVLAVSLALSTFRADIVVALCAGVFLTRWMRWSPGLSMGRGAAMLTSLLGLLAAAGVQLYLMKVRYPQARYGDVPAIMLPYDYKQWSMWTGLLVFIAPAVWTAAQVLRRRSAGEAAGGAMLVAAGIYLGLWILMGRLDEVRIFLPMAMALLPLTVEMAMRKVQESVQETAHWTAQT